MGHPLLDCGSLHDLADLRQVIETKEELDSFEQLAGIVTADLASLEAAKRPQNWRQLPVDIRLSFGWADVRRQFPALEGHVSATIVAICQRCLEPFELALDVRLKLRFVQTDAVAAQQEGFDDWELDEEMLRPLDIVEEALIMALPLAAMHEVSERCGALQERAAPGDAEKLRPFAELRSKMNDTN
jgi:uncharacterized protein